VHDVADGGLIVAAAEMALATGVGMWLENETPIPAYAWAFGEDQGCYLVCTHAAHEVIELARTAGIPAIKVGFTGGKELKFPGATDILLDDLRRAHEGFFPELMGGELAIA
jgi:phosphoribosylformylglycinamidine synthase